MTCSNTQETSTEFLFPLGIQDWLSKFGYLPPADPVTGQLQTKEALTKAIKAMQRFGGLEETGVFGRCLSTTSHNHSPGGRKNAQLKTFLMFFSKSGYLTVVMYFCCRCDCC